MTTSIEAVQAETHQSHGKFSRVGHRCTASRDEWCTASRVEMHCKQSSLGKLSSVRHRCAASIDAEQRSTASKVEMHCKQGGDVLQAELWRQVVQGDSSFFHFSLDCSRRWQQHAVVCMQFALRYFLIFSSFGTYVQYFIL